MSIKIPSFHQFMWRGKKGPEGMNRYRIGAVVTVALALCILCATVLKLGSGRGVTKNVERSSKQEKETKVYMTYDDWLQGKFYARSFYPDWVTGNQYSSMEDDFSIVLVDKDGTKTQILNGDAWMSLSNPQNYFISGDQDYVAITYDSIDGYAHYMTFYSVAVFKTSDSSRLTIPGEQLENVQKLKWDPVGHKMAFVKNFNIFVTDLTSAADQVTNDGEENVKFNGITDWLYYVEITDDDALLWWSPNGTYLAYATIDNSQVKNFDFALFKDGIYPNMINFPYPKPGTPIPATETFLYNPEGTKSYALTPSYKVYATWNNEYYLNSAVWRDDNIFTPTWKNRLENEAVSDTCEIEQTAWLCKHVDAMESISTTGWLGHYKPAHVVPTPKSNEYITVLSDDTGFFHLVVVDAVADTKEWRTSGSFEVADTGSGDTPIYFYDSDNDWVYFTSTENPDDTGKGLPRIRHMWRVKGHGSDMSRQCITCALNDAGETKDRCNWVTPSFSPDGSIVVVNCGGTANNPPISTMHEINSNGDVGTAKVVVDNAELVSNLEKYYFRTSEFGEITLPDLPDEVFYYTLHKPPNFDAAKSYPMLVLVYSGPGFQYTTDRFYGDWTRCYLASSDLDVIVMTFDGRGTGFRGEDIMHKVYRNLGKYEPIDQIEAATQVSRKYDYIDNSRIAIWGRSYGGYATSRTIGEDENQIFKCGFAVAPVTDWLTYHTIYTERYMRSPDIDDNQIGYNESTAIQKMHNFGKHYFALVHGTSDENVHFLNSARLSKALIEADVDFSAYFAGDETHSFNRFPMSYGHHYKLLTRHVRTCFGI